MRKTNLLFIFLFAFFIAGCHAHRNAPRVPAGDRCPVARIVDGDTIIVYLNGVKERIRYIGMDTPETKHPRKPVQYCGREASEENRRLVEGKTVTLVYDVEKRDRYGRLLAYVYVDGIFVNAELVKRGYAMAYTYPPNVAHSNEFAEYQRQARMKGLGLWGEGKCSPVE